MFVVQIEEPDGKISTAQMHFLPRVGETVQILSTKGLEVEAVGHVVADARTSGPSPMVQHESRVQIPHLGRLRQSKRGSGMNSSEKTDDWKFQNVEE